MIGLELNISSGYAKTLRIREKMFQQVGLYKIETKKWLLVLLIDFRSLVHSGEVSEDVRVTWHGQRLIKANVDFVEDCAAQESQGCHPQKKFYLYFWDNHLVENAT